MVVGYLDINPIVCIYIYKDIYYTRWIGISLDTRASRRPTIEEKTNRVKNFLYPSTLSIRHGRLEEAVLDETVITRAAENDVV